jgi:hypothetical protein
MRALGMVVGLVGLIWAGSTAAAQELDKKEKSALQKVERELITLAKFALKAKDYAGALAELQFAQAVWKDAPRVPGELKKLQKAAKKGGDIKKGHAEKMAAKREDAYAKVAMALVSAAEAIRESAPSRFNHYVGVIQRRCPDKKALDKLDLAYFAPYRSWFPSADVKKLEAGSEYIDGTWVEAAKVAELNKAHDSLDNPWVVADEVHEVRSRLPYRKVKQVLCYVGHYRRFFLEQYGAEWDLRPPQGKLPVILTGTRNDLEAEMIRVTGGRAGGGGQGAAFYLQTNGSLNPCFVSYEIKGANGPAIKVEKFEDILVALIHEITHQICFEYSKHDYDNTRQIAHHFWSVEAFANHLGYYTFDGKDWRLTKPRTVDGGGGFYTEGPFFWCQKPGSRIPKIAEFIRIPPAQFPTIENYHVAATFTYFLIEGEGGKYRHSYIKLLEQVHKVKDTADLWDKCFPNVDPAAMDTEFAAFIKAIKLDG